MARSEVAQLRQRIEEEYTAAQRALYGPAMVAKHEFITARMEGVHRAHEELKSIVGEEEAIQLVVFILDSIGEARAIG